MTRIRMACDLEFSPSLVAAWEFRLDIGSPEQKKKELGSPRGQRPGTSERRTSPRQKKQQGWSLDDQPCRGGKGRPRGAYALPTLTARKSSSPWRLTRSRTEGAFLATACWTKRSTSPG